MKKAVTILLLWIILLTGCSDSVQWSQTKVTQEGILYQDVDGYQAAVLDRSLIESEQVLVWLEQVETLEHKNGFYQYIQSDPEKWEMLLYWPSEKRSAEQSPNVESMRFCITKDQLVQIVFDQGEQVEAELLILVQSKNARGAWPADSLLQVGQDNIPQLEPA